MKTFYVLRTSSLLNEMFNRFLRKRCRLLYVSLRYLFCRKTEKGEVHFELYETSFHVDAA
ncbi:hypothetical protein ATG71_1212 [Bacillus sp. es.034]|nr:hypothetical protein ATG71_1212 [Bacillus sp. es.034]